jgi:hypothetical protein
MTTVTLTKRLLLARHVLRDMVEHHLSTKLACLAAIIVILWGTVAAAINSPTAFIALIFTLSLCAYLIWTLEPVTRNLDAMILQLVRLEIGGHGLIIDFEKPAGRVFISGDVKVENATGCEIRLRSYRFEQIGIDSPGAAPMALQTPESACDEIVPHDESRSVKLEKNEIFGGREGLGDAACVPMKLTVSVHFDVEGENIAASASRTLQCYALIRSVPRDEMLLP